MFTQVNWFSGKFRPYVFTKPGNNFKFKFNWLSADFCGTEGLFVFVPRREASAKCFSVQLIPEDLSWVTVILTAVFWSSYCLLGIVAHFNIPKTLPALFSLFPYLDRVSERLCVCLTIVHLQKLKGKPSALHSSLNKHWFILNNRCGTPSVVKGNITKTSGFILVSRLLEPVAQTVIKKDKQMLKSDWYIFSFTLFLK